MNPLCHLLLFLYIIRKNQDLHAASNLTCAQASGLKVTLPSIHKHNLLKSHGPTFYFMTTDLINHKANA